MVKRRRGYKRSWNAPAPVENCDVEAKPHVPRYSRALLDETREIWQPHYGELLSDEDCREIIESMTGFARLLIRTNRPSGRNSPPTRKSRD